MKDIMNNRIFKKITALVCVAVLSCFSFISCSVQRAYPGAPDGMRPINDGSIGAVLFVPSYWSVDTSAGIPMGYVSTNDRTMVTLAYVSADELDGRSPQEYWNSYAEQFREAISDFSVVKDYENAKDYSTRIIAGKDAYEFEFTGNITGLKYHYRQALLRSDDGGLYMITYSASEEKYDTHLDILLGDIYDNFTFTNEILSVEDNNTLPPESDEGVSVPDGMQLISNGAVDYLMFVPESWTVLMNTGVSAARVSDTDETTVSTTAFNTRYTYKQIDEFWSSRETDIINTFGNMTYISESRYVDITVDGYDARTYDFTISRGGIDHRYSETVLIRDGYVYLITCCSKAETADLHTAEYEQIISQFKFK